MIHVGHLAPSGCWDQNLIKRLLDGDLYPHSLRVTHHEGYPNTEGAALLIPGRYWFQHTDRINEAISKLRWVLAFRVSDEEDLFDIDQVEHPNIRWWVQTPNPQKTYTARLFGVGFPPHFNQCPQRERLLDVFLSGQDTHPRRTAAFAELEGYGNVHRTPGFTQGMQPDEYTVCMASAKVAPAPSGPETADTFRVWEALEAHTLPVADDVSPRWGAGFWEKTLPGHQFPTYTEPQDLPGIVAAGLDGWPGNVNRTTAWWMRQKRVYRDWLLEDLQALGAL